MKDLLMKRKNDVRTIRNSHEGILMPTLYMQMCDARLIMLCCLYLDPSKYIWHCNAPNTVHPKVTIPRQQVRFVLVVKGKMTMYWDLSRIYVSQLIMIQQCGQKQVNKTSK